MNINSGYWNFRKSSRQLVCFLIATTCCILVPFYFSPESEILNNISSERLFLYSVFFALGFIITGEMTGFFEIENQKSFINKFFLGLLTSSFACSELLFIFWLVEYDFIGRFAILNIGLWVGFLSVLFLLFADNLIKSHSLRVLVLSDNGFQSKVQSYLGQQNSKIFWVNGYSSGGLEGLAEFCQNESVDVILLDQSERKTEDIDIFTFIESGIRVLGVTSFVEMQSQKIPPNEVDRVWLTKLDLRLKDPLIKRTKRTIDLFIATIGLIFSFPIIFIACVFIFIESGFPLFFHQNRTGLLGRPYVLHKLRTMIKNAEEKGAVWAQKNDLRVTKVGYFLRKWRIDEIPQFWNVIKGDMSIVGPRPERPELEGKIAQNLPYWKCRSLVKPGLTGWAQIRYEYASDMESSEEKLAYDLYYLKNASFFLDLEIMLSTLRSLTRGSR